MQNEHLHKKWEGVVASGLCSSGRLDALLGRPEGFYQFQRVSLRRAETACATACGSKVLYLTCAQTQVYTHGQHRE